jgi:hypothetical protein
LPAAQGLARRQCLCGWLGRHPIAICWLGKDGAACGKYPGKNGDAKKAAGKSTILVGGFHQVTPLKSASTCVAVDEL